MALASGLGLLALFSLISILLGDEDSRASNDPWDDVFPWLGFARH